MDLIEQASEIGSLIAYRQNGDANLTEYALHLALSGNYHAARSLRNELSFDNPARDFIPAVIHLKQGDYFLAELDCRRAAFSDPRLSEKLDGLRNRIIDARDSLEDIKLPEKAEPEEVAA